MKIGNKIRKIRELKNITPKDMADRLNITTQSYHKIEREEVTINMDRLLELSEIFGMKPEDVITFDEKQIFNNYGEKSIGINNTYNNFPEELRRLYEENARLQEEKNKLQSEMIEMLKEKVKGLEKK